MNTRHTARSSSSTSPPTTGTVALAPDRVTLLGWSIPVWLLRTLSVVLLAVIGVAVYVLVTSSIAARAEAEFRGCQVDQLQKATTVDRTVDAIIDAQTRLAQATTAAEARRIRLESRAKLEGIKRDRAQARVDQDTQCVAPPR